jgi:hypothetical protein
MRERGRGPSASGKTLLLGSKKILLLFSQWKSVRTGVEISTQLTPKKGSEFFTTWQQCFFPLTPD